MRKKLSNLNQSVYALRVIRISYLWILMMYLTGCSTTIIDIPIALHKAGSVIEADFEIPQDDRVAFRLWFLINDQSGDKERLLDFLGNELKPDKSISIPLKVKIIQYSIFKSE